MFLKIKSFLLFTLFCTNTFAIQLSNSLESTIPDYKSPKLEDIIQRLSKLNKKEKIPRYRGGGGQPYGCVTSNTKVTMANGTKKLVNELISGDLIENVLGDTVKVLEIIKGPEKDKLLTISVANKSVTATKDHPFISIQGYMQAKDFRVGEYILTKDGYEKIKSISLTNYQEDVYNLYVSPESYNFGNPTSNYNLLLEMTMEERSLYLNEFSSGDLLIQTLLN